MDKNADKDIEKRQKELDELLEAMDKDKKAEKKCKCDCACEKD